jgi:hypothetical protein
MKQASKQAATTISAAVMKLDAVTQADAVLIPVF